MYSWRRSAMFIRRFYRRGRGRKPTSEGNAAVLPLKIVDTRVLLRHLHVTAAPRRGNRERFRETVRRPTDRSSKARSEEKPRWRKRKRRRQARSVSQMPPS